MMRLALVDDHAMLRDGLRRKFDDCPDMECCIEAGSGRELLEKMAATPVDVIVLDIKLPDTNGILFTRQLKQRYPNCKVVILTMYDQERYAKEALIAGADAFIIKGSPFDKLLSSIRNLRRMRSAGEKTPVKAKGRASALRPAKPLDVLSSREFEVLILIGSGLPLKEVGVRMGISDKSVATYRSRMMKKLNLTTNADLIQFAIETGVLQ
jgi:DNA-binding NarL/FixJ family response regulator